MKRQPLAGYLERIKSARDKQDWSAAKRIGETALKRLRILSYSHLEEHFLYRSLGYIYYNLLEYSRSLDTFYKAYSVGLKHHLAPEHLAYTALRIGLNLQTIKSINSALTQFQKVEQYYQKYGDNSLLMNKQIHLSNSISIGYCYLYKDDLAKVEEFLKKITPLNQVLMPNDFSLLNYHHLRGEYLVAIKQYQNAREAFQECIKVSGQISFPTGILEARIHLGILDLLENRIDNAIGGLSNVQQESRSLKFNNLFCEAGLLLSKCYLLKNLPGKSASVEERIKPILSKLDTTWLYEKVREFEKLYHQLKNTSTQTQTSSMPMVLVHTINHRYDISPYKEIIIGNCLQMQDIWQIVEKIAPTDLPVLLQGETGSGKEIIAHAIYYNSHRVGKPWLAFNCGATPETLIESHLFGHTKGAFTDAKEDKKGYIELTDSGTLFVDEIASMSPAMQQKLLRVLEEKQVWRVGAQKPIPADTRFIFASNQDIERMVKNKLFREDLFYRINTIVINLPPLRDRKDDIPLLAQHFLGKYSPKTQDAKRITPDALALLAAYPWPGNIRELENEIKRLCVLYPDAKSITETMLSETIQHYQGITTSYPPRTIKELTERYHRDIIVKTLKEHKGNIIKTAQCLGYARSGLYKKLKELNIKAEDISH